MKSEAEIREWRREMKIEYGKNAHIPTMGAGIQNSIATLDWVLGDTAEGDVTRVHAAMLLAGWDHAETLAWLIAPHPQLHDLTPMQYVVGGEADTVITLIEQKAV